jgi:hypothetical protein
MRSQNLLWGLFLWKPLAALSIQQHVAQLPMLSEQQHTTKSTVYNVILAFVENGGSRVHRVEVPLRRQIPSGR